MDGLDYRRKANRVLGMVFVLFAGAAAARFRFPESLTVMMVFTVAEAALVGGIADWFAVTALFRRPMGFPWHTALIPQSRDKIIDAIAGAVQNELLSKESIKRRLAGVRLIDLFIRWLEEDDRQALLPEAAAIYAQAVWDHLDFCAAAGLGEKWLKAALYKANLQEIARQGLSWALATGKVDRLIEKLLAALTAAAAQESTCQAMEQYIVQYSHNAAKSWWQQLVLNLAENTDTLNTAEAAAVLHHELMRLLGDLAEADHPVRGWLRARLAAATDRLADDPDWEMGIASWQKGLVGRLQLEEALTAAAGIVIRNVPPEWPAAWAARQAVSLWDALKADDVLQDRAEEQLKDILGRFIDSEYDLVATVVREALARLSNEDLNRFIEDKAGEDLAWIRINGSVVGGVVGLLLFLFLHYLYDPYVVPLVHALLK